MKNIQYLILGFLWLEINYLQASHASEATESVEQKDGGDVNGILIANHAFATIRSNKGFIQNLSLKPDQDILKLCANTFADPQEQLHAILFVLGGSFGSISYASNFKDYYLQQLEDSKELIREFGISDSQDPWEDFSEVCRGMHKRFRLMDANYAELEKEITCVQLNVMRARVQKKETQDLSLNTPARKIGNGIGNGRRITSSLIHLRLHQGKDESSPGAADQDSYITLHYSDDEL